MRRGNCVVLMLDLIGYNQVNYLLEYVSVWIMTYNSAEFSGLDLTSRLFDD